MTTKPTTYNIIQDQRTLDEIPPATGPIDAGGEIISNVGSPGSSTDVATRGYVDQYLNGLAWRPTVRFLDDTHTSRPTGDPVLVDGSNVNAGDRVLFTLLTITLQNDVVYKAVGTLTNITGWTTEIDGQAGDGLPTDGDAIFVKEGTTYHDKGFVYSGSAFIQFSALSEVWSRILGTPNYVRPANTNDHIYPNGTTDIGATGSKFRSLYLSGTAYIGTMAQYDAHPTFNADTQIVDKKYVDDAVGAENLWDRAQSPYGDNPYYVQTHNVADHLMPGTTLVCDIGGPFNYPFPFWWRSAFFNNSVYFGKNGDSAAWGYIRGSSDSVLIYGVTSIQLYKTNGTGPSFEVNGTGIYISQDLIPTSNGVLNLGDSTHYFNKLWIGDVQLSNTVFTMQGSVNRTYINGTGDNIYMIAGWGGATIANYYFQYNQGAGVIDPNEQFVLHMDVGNTISTFYYGVDARANLGTSSYRFKNGYFGGDVVVSDAAKGLVLKDTQSPAHYWRITVDYNTSDIVVTDIGTTVP